MARLPRLERAASNRLGGRDVRIGLERDLVRPAVMLGCGRHELDPVRHRRLAAGLCEVEEDILHPAELLEPACRVVAARSLVVVAYNGVEPGLAEPTCVL